MVADAIEVKFTGYNTHNLRAVNNMPVYCDGATTTDAWNDGI
jgi:hypothetical protein